MNLRRLLSVLRLRVRSLIAGRAIDRELDDELGFHVDRQIEVNLANGMTPAEARTAALRSIGGLEQRKEQMRDERRVAIVENLGRDIRMAFRQLGKQPAFTLAAIVSLALGIGANTAIFQLLNALSLRTLPVSAPEQLVELRMIGDGHAGRQTGRNRQVSLPQFEAIRQRQQAFSQFFAFGDTRFNLSPQGEVRYVDGLWVSGDFFPALGVGAVLGRLIGPSDDRPGCGNSVGVISYALWQREYAGRRDIIGQTIVDGSARIEIVGVTPPEFFGMEVGRQFGLARPICASGNTRRDHWWLAAVGRLKPGWTREMAQAHLRTLLAEVQRDTMPDFRADYADSYMKMELAVVDASAGVSPLRASYERPLWTLVAIASLVLLIAAVNLANLLLARGTVRAQEFAIRLALGGSAGRLFQQVLTESLLLAALGSIAAVGVAVALSQSIPPLISTTVDRIYLDLSIDWRVFAFTAAVGAATAMIFGTAPSLRAARSSMLRGAQRGAASNDGLALRRLLAATQIAVTLVLLFSGLQFVRSFINLTRQDTGVNERNVVMAVLFFRESEYPAERRPAAYRAIDERIGALPGVVSFSDAYTTPLGGSMWDTDLQTDRGASGSSNGNRIGPGYFATLGTKLLAGRDFTTSDVPGAPRVAIVNQSFARKYYDGAAIGRRFTLDDRLGGPGTELEIVGVVADQKYMVLREANPRIFFLPSAQDAPLPATRRYVVRSTEDPARTIAAIGQTVAAVDPNISLRYALLDTQIVEGMLQERLMARLSALFGLVALVLAVVGLYGVVSYMVASRLPEIGVRVAFGASRSRILSMILGDVSRFLMVGVAAGVILSLLASRAIVTLLFGLQGADLTTLALATAVLAFAGLLSAFLPARRAAGVDPVTALRES